MMRAGAVGIVAMLGMCSIAAQERTAPQFEVASVRPRAIDMSTPLSFTVLGDGLTAINYPLVWLITAAYGVQETRLEHLPSWARTERFDIRAKASQPASRTEMLEMLRGLLSDRFKLKAHTEARVSDVYLLTRLDPTSLGRGLHPVTIDCDSNTLSPSSAPGLFPPDERPKCGMSRVEMRDGNALQRRAAVTLTSFASSLSGSLGRPVLDRTALIGTFDIELHHRDDAVLQFIFNPTRRAEVEANPTAPTLRDALREQLGLMVTPGRESVEFLIIDSIERPTAD